MRYTGLLLFLALCLGGLGGCHPSSVKEEKKVRLSINDEPQSLDPRKARQLDSSILVHWLFDGLMREGKEGQLESAVADHVDVSSDLMTYTFHLKKTQWSNGDPVTAVDFAYAWKKILSPDFPSDLSFLFYHIKNAKKAKEGLLSVHETGIIPLDDETLQVQLEVPTPYFLALIAQPVFSPVNHKVDEQNPSWAQQAATFVSNGPFTLEEWKHSHHLTLKKNALYWDASLVHLDALSVDMLSEATELQLFEKKELDWAGSPLSRLPLESLKGLQEQGSLKSLPALATTFLRLNTQDPCLALVKVRRALALAIDRSALAEHVTRGGQRPATRFVPPLFHLHEAPYFPDAASAEAKKMFEEALSQLQMTKESFPELTYLYRSNEKNHLMAQAIQQQWREVLGVRVKLEAVEGKVFFSRVSKQDYQIAYGDWVADFADPINFLEVFKSRKGGSNNTLWEREEFAALLERSTLLPPGEERQKLLARAEGILMEEMPIIPLLHLNLLYIAQPHLKDVVVSSNGQLDFKWASLEETR